MKIDPKLWGIIEEEDIADLNASTNTIYLVWSDLTIAFLNDAWFEFARENQGNDAFFETFGVGSSIDVGGDDPMHQHFLDCIEKSLREDRVVAFQYECPTPDTFRLMQVNFLPLTRDLCAISVARVVTSSHQEHGRAPRDGAACDYEKEDGFISMCSCCRRVRVPGTEHSWDFVPSLLRNPVDNLSHTLCESCKAYWFTSVAPAKEFSVGDLTREFRRDSTPAR